MALSEAVIDFGEDEGIEDGVLDDGRPGLAVHNKSSYTTIVY